MRLVQTLFVLAGVVSAAGAAVAQPSAPAPASAPRLTLDEAVRRAVDASEEARAAGVRREQASADVSAARAALLPTLTATGTYTRRSRSVERDDVTIQSANALGGNLTLSASLFDARAYPLLRAARRGREAAALDERARRREVAFDAAEAYLAALGQEQVVEAAARRRELAAARQRDVAARVEARLVSTNDRTQTELELATAERDLATARASLAVAYEELAWWIGGPVTGPLVEPAGLLERGRAPAPEAPGLRDDARRERPDLAAARLRVEVARELAEEPDRRAWPSLDLTAQYRFTNEAGFSGRNSDWLVGLTASWVIWDGGARAAEARHRDLDVELARLEVVAAERRTDADLAAAVARLRGAQAALGPAEQVATAAARNTDEVAVLYQQGLVRALDVVDAGARRFDAEVALVRAKLDIAAAWLALAAAAGTGPVPGQERP